MAALADRLVPRSGVPFVAKQCFHGRIGARHCTQDSAGGLPELLHIVWMSIFAGGPAGSIKLQCLVMFKERIRFYRVFGWSAVPDFERNLIGCARLRPIGSVCPNCLAMRS